MSGGPPGLFFFKAWATPRRSTVLGQLPAVLGGGQPDTFFFRLGPLLADQSSLVSGCRLFWAAASRTIFYFLFFIFLGKTYGDELRKEINFIDFICSNGKKINEKNYNNKIADNTFSSD